MTQERIQVPERDALLQRCQKAVGDQIEDLVVESDRVWSAYLLDSDSADIIARLWRYIPGFRVQKSAVWADMHLTSTVYIQNDGPGSAAQKAMFWDIIGYKVTVEVMTGEEK